jgi:hypothetical protein
MIEIPSYKFYKSAVTYHLIEVNHAGSDPVSSVATTESHNGNVHNCLYFNSFESDLLNFQNQKKPPFFSKLALQNQSVKLITPTEYSFNSEGNKYLLFSARTELSVNISISYTQLKYSDDRVWHLTIAPAANEFFTEYDLIKLTSFFGSSQEDSSVRHQLSFASTEFSGFSTPESLIPALLPDLVQRRLIRMGTGIIQIDESNLKNLSADLMEKFFLTFRGGTRIEIDKEIRNFSKALCGIILGIFDFDRMADQELFDTIQSVMADRTSMVVLCRGALLKLSKESDEMMDAVSSHIIVNPYLLIPSMVLSYNEYILDAAKKNLNNTLRTSSAKKLEELEATHAHVNMAINFHCLQDIFQYQSEKEIIEKGNLQRGVTNTREFITKRLEELTKKIEIKRGNNSNKSDAFLNSILALIATVQLKSFFESFSLIDDKNISNYLFYSLCFAFSAIIFQIVLSKKIKIRY